MKRRTRHLRILGCLTTIGCLVCTMCGILGIANSVERSIWIGSDTTKVEIGSISRATMPYGPDIPIEIRSLHEVSGSSGLVGDRKMLASWETPSGKRQDCTYEGHPVISMGMISVRLWKCAMR